MNNSSGFTLIEYIVVTLIIAILAAVALPNIFSNVTKSQGTTAIAAMDEIKDQLETCTSQQGVAPSADAGSSPCTASRFGLISSNGFNFDVYGGSTPVSQSATSGTIVVLSGSPVNGNMSYSIIATDVSGNVISLTRSTNGTYTCSPPNSGVYAQAC